MKTTYIMNIIRNRINGVVLLLGATMLIAAGCQRDEFASMEYAQSDAVVRFAPSIAAMSGDDELTKATLYNTTDDNTHKLSEYSITEFQVTAWEGTSGTTNFIPAGTKVKYITGWNPDGEGEDESFWSAVDGSGNIKEYTWKKSDGSKTFYAYANLPASGASVACASAAGQMLTITSLPIASENQTDILLGLYQGDGSTGSPAKKTGTASIHFYHPLTAVQFKKGTLSDGVSITGISIEGVYTSGKTTQTPSTGTAFTWTKTDGSAFTATDETGTVSLSDVTVDDDGFIGDAIVLIPQTFSIDSKTRIVISCNVNGTDRTLYWPLLSGSWKAGCTNGYALNYDASGNLTLSVTAWGTSFPAEDLEFEDPYNGHEYVEIGGRKWATCCIGATSPKDYGSYFFWGDTEGYVRDIANSKWVKASDPTAELSGGFSWVNTTHHTGGSSTTGWTKYIPTGKSSYCSGGGSPDDKLVLDPEDDIAHVNWGGSWRMPTQADFQALYEACGGTGTEKNSLVALPSANPPQGIYRVTAGQTYISDYNGVAGILFCDGTNKLFFPAAGYGNGANLNDAGSKGHYWSSSLDTSDPAQAYYLYFTTTYVGPQRVLNRCDGRSVRPVSD